MAFAECLPKFIPWITKCIFYLEIHKTSFSTGYCTQANFEWSRTRQEAPKNSIDLYNKMFHHLFFSYLLFLAWAFQQVQDDDLLRAGFICLSSSSEIIPKCDGSSSIIFATKYPAIDHVWYFLACFPIYLPVFPS